jgi:hypothetical protein
VRVAGDAWAPARARGRACACAGWAGLLPKGRGVRGNEVQMRGGACTYAVCDRAQPRRRRAPSSSAAGREAAAAAVPARGARCCAVWQGRRRRAAGGTTTRVGMLKTLGPHAPRPHPTWRPICCRWSPPCSSSGGTCARWLRRDSGWSEGVRGRRERPSTSSRAHSLGPSASSYCCSADCWLGPWCPNRRHNHA